MLRKPIAALAGGLLLAGIAAAPAGAKTGDVVVRSRCSLGAEASSRSLHAARTTGRRSSSRSTRT